MASYLVFIAIHVVAAAKLLHGMLPLKAYRLIRNTLIIFTAVVGGLVVVLVGLYLSQSPTMGWSGRSLTLLVSVLRYCP